MLGEQQSPVGEDVELALRPGYRSRSNAELRADLGRETRGSLVVAASGRAVEDLDRHSRNIPA